MKSSGSGRGKAMAAGLLVALLVALAAVNQAAAACGNVNSLLSCLPAARTGSQPAQSCCQAMAAFAQGGTAGGEACLCEAVSNPTARSAGAQPQYAIQIPQKCDLNYKAGYICNGILVPGGHP